MGITTMNTCSIIASVWWLWNLETFAAPTEACNASDLHGVNWRYLLSYGAPTHPVLLKNASLEFDADNVSLYVRVQLEYVGLSADGNFNDDFILGTTYWIDFQSFSEVGSIASAGTCANRRSADYESLDWSEYWNYTVDPAKLDTVSNAERMAYPPSNWTLTALSCNVVEYERTFSWAELTSCTGASGENVIAVDETDDSVVLSGTLFVELVSPYSTVYIGYYRIYPLLQWDIGIAVPRDQTLSPTLDPTATPTSGTILETSAGPTEACNASDLHGVSWHELLNDPPYYPVLLKNYTLDFDYHNLSLYARVQLEYVGLSGDGNWNNDFTLGTTYWIDFQSFSDVNRIDSAGTCANRRSADYESLDWSEYWNYTVDPAKLDTVSNAERMAYPPSNWTLTALSCNVVEYERTFSWTELTSCTGASGENVIAVDQTDDSVVLSGSLFVELVSPYSTVDTGYYRTYLVTQHDFSIAVSRDQTLSPTLDPTASPTSGTILETFTDLTMPPTNEILFDPTSEPSFEPTAVPTDVAMNTNGARGSFADLILLLPGLFLYALR